MLVIGALCALLTWFGTSFRHKCWYVGMEGVARLACAQTRERVVEREVFLFKYAIGLRQMKTTHTRDHAELFHYDWHDLKGNSVFQITINPNSWSAVARAAEEAWNKYIAHVGSKFSSTIEARTIRTDITRQ
ncbi:hypothetical protein AYO44_18565 [Planctomycetaceae bacterium SCGC AG-212-F19]|nr:hypothetical protein AYO44_18565 [Planctomycetaceae bacterium SCGC AG-212-F19]